MFLIAIGFVGCTLPVNPDYDYATFIADLADNGFRIQETSATVNHGFSMDGYQSSKDGVEIFVNGEILYVYEFNNIADAETAASRIDGSGWRFSYIYGEYCVGRCGKVSIREDFSWDQPPHFYQKGRLIVVYVGKSAEISEGLGKILRNEFAGFGIDRPPSEDQVIDATMLALTPEASPGPGYP
jgi:hypothetical protein